MLTDKRLIFTVTSGRSGTMYLAHILRGIPHLWVRHEPAPGFQAALPQARTDPAIATQFLQELKLPFIASVQRPVYMETSHYFAKGFLEPLMELGHVPDLVILRRDARKVAASWFMIGVRMRRLVDPARPQSRHIITPAEPSFLPASETWRDWNDYQVCYWYALETHFRARHYARLVQAHGGKVFDTFLKPLASGPKYRELLLWLGVSEEESLIREADVALRSAIVNPKIPLKRHHARGQEFQALDLDALEAQVRTECQLTLEQEETLRKGIFA